MLSTNVLEWLFDQGWNGKLFTEVYTNDDDNSEEDYIITFRKY